MTAGGKRSPPRVAMKGIDTFKAFLNNWLQKTAYGAKYQTLISVIGGRPPITTGA